MCLEVGEEMVKSLFKKKDKQSNSSTLLPGQQSTQAWLPLYDINNRLIYRRDKHIVAGVRVEPINIHLLSEKEQDAKIRALHEVLNGIDYEYEVYINARPVDLDGYIVTLTDRQRNEENFLKKRLLDGYIRQAAMLATGGEALEREFYYFISQPIGKKANLAENELLARGTELAANLTSAGLTSNLCTDQELRDVLFIFTNPQQAAYERAPNTSEEMISTLYRGI